MSSPERQLEDNFIQKLVSLKYEYRPDIRNRATLQNKGIYATRQLAKRQLTWLRAMAGVANFDCVAQDAGAQVLSHLQRKLQG